LYGNALAAELAECDPAHVLIQAGLMLPMAQFTVGVGSIRTDAGRQQASRLGLQHQTDIAYVVLQAWLACGKCQHQKLHCELGIYHAAWAVLEVKLAGRHRVGSPQFMTQ
jgi:hypothetical protein